MLVFGLCHPPTKWIDRVAPELHGLPLTPHTNHFLKQDIFWPLPAFVDFAQCTLKQ